MPAFEIWPFEPRAWNGDVANMTPAERGAYISLLVYYWLNRGLPTDDDQLRRITGLPDLAWKRSRAKIQSRFYNGWRHARVEHDLAAAAKFHGKQKANAKRRWENNTGDKNMSGHSSRGIGQPERFQTLKNSATHAVAMPKKERIDSLPLELEGSTSAVEKVQAGRLPNKANGQPSEVRQRRAQHSWEAALRHQLGSRYADAIGVLAADKALCERATLAELRKPGSGVMAALLGLRGKLASSSLGDDDL